jgi:hypothetical protein
MVGDMKTKLALIALILTIFAGLTIYLHGMIAGAPVENDWGLTYYPAIQAAIHGENPYQAADFVNPPWALIPLAAIGALSATWSMAIIFTANLAAFLFTMQRLRIPAWMIAPLVAFSGVIGNSRLGNIEGLVALGFVMSPTIGLFFVLAKPQIGIGIAVYWAVEAWRAGGWRKMLRTVAPVTIAYLLAFLIFSNFMARATVNTDVTWNTAWFPYGIPIGLLLMAISIGARHPGPAMAASVFFSPYVNAITWTFFWVGLAAWLSSPDSIHFITANKASKTGTTIAYSAKLPVLAGPRMRHWLKG